MGRDWLLPLYDPFTRLLGVRALHQRLVDQADLRAGLRVLEIGCGTGNLTVLIKRQYPGTTVVGLDPDPRALARAGRKARRAGLPVELDRGFADQLPYPDGSVDRVLSALMLHHLAAAERLAALREAVRVLAPGGSLHLVDFAAPSHRSGHPLGRLAHRRHQHAPAADDIPALLPAAGFTDARETGHGSNPFGRYTYHRATR
jgi:ubiquinone/menaquinone biosynthesis C-methylase UbiE